MTSRCQGCHASTSPDRQNAPEAIVFDDHDKVLDLVDSLLELQPHAAGHYIQKAFALDAAERPVV